MIPRLWAVLFVWHLLLLVASAVEDLENGIDELSNPSITDFSGGLETHPDGSVWFRWTAAAGYSDQLEFGDGLGSWEDTGAPVYGFGHTVEVKLLDAPAGGGQGQGGGGATQEVLSIDAIVNVFADGRILLSFSALGEPVKVLLDIDFSDMVERPFLAKTYERPDPQLDCQVVLFFQTREWLPHFADYALAGLTLSPEAQEIVTAFVGLASAIHADLLLPLGAENQTAQSVLSGDPGALGFVRVRRNNADLDRDGIADAVEFAGFLGFFDPFSWDTDGDGVPDYLEGVGGAAEKAKPGAGDEDDPNDPPQPAFSPPRYVVYPLGGQFMLGSGWTFRDAWITDTSVVAAVKENGLEEWHLVRKGTTITELWPRTTYPRAKLLDASRSGRFLLDATIWDSENEVEKQQYQVANENSVETMTGIPLVAAMPKSEIVAMPYYTARIAEFAAAFPEIELDEPEITQSIHSLWGISEAGNVAGIIRVDVSLVPSVPGSGPAGPSFGMLLPYFWKTGFGGGQTGSLHEYFTPDSEDRYWTESGPNPPYIHTPAAPNFLSIYFGGLDILMHSSQGAVEMIGVAWPGFALPQYPVPAGFDPHDGSMWGSTVSASTSFKERSLDDIYDDSQLPAIPTSGTELTNKKWWHIAELNRPADPGNNIPAIVGPAFVIRASNGAGARTWQAWALQELVAGTTGISPWWSNVEPKHLANTGAMVAGIQQEPTTNRQLVILLPVEIDIVQSSGATTPPNIASQDDDFAVVSLGTDPDLASELVVSMPHLPDGVTATVNLQLVGTDGGLIFEQSSLPITPGSTSSTRIWGSAASTAENSSKIALEFVMSGASINPVIEEDLTIIDGVKLSFEGTFYSPVDSRVENWRPWLARGDPATAITEDGGDTSSKISFCDGDQTVVYRSDSTKPKVTITKIEAVTPSFELKYDPMVGAEVWFVSGKFRHNTSTPDVPPGTLFSNPSEEEIDDPEIEFRPTTGGTEAYFSASVVDPSNVTQISITPQVTAGIPGLAASIGGKAAGGSALANWLMEPPGPNSRAIFIENLSKLSAEWINDNFASAKGGLLRQSSAAKAAIGAQEIRGIDKTVIEFSFDHYNGWTLNGKVTDGQLTTP